MRMVDVQNVNETAKCSCNDTMSTAVCWDQNKRTTYNVKVGDAESRHCCRNE